MYTERALSCHTRNRLILTNLAITLRYRDHTIDRLGVMAQKAEKMLLKGMIIAICNFFQKSESSKYR